MSARPSVAGEAPLLPRSGRAAGVVLARHGDQGGVVLEIDEVVHLLRRGPDGADGVAQEKPVGEPEPVIWTVRDLQVAPVSDAVS